MTLFIARCVAVPPGLDTPHAATLVGLADTPDNLKTRARTALEASGHTFIALEDTTEAQTHLRLHGETELVAALIAAVTDAAPIQLSGFFPAGEAQRTQDTDPVLCVERHAITPLDPDDKRPFWDQTWCPPELAKLLFEGPKRTYALIDAAKRTELRGGFDIDALNMIAEITCLYTGETAEDLAEVAPYLLDLTPFGEDGASIPAPLRDLFAKQWTGGACMILRVDADLAAAKRHLRHFLRIRSSEDAELWTIFRFWDPAAASIYFPGIAARPERVNRIFRASPDLPVDIITPDRGEALHLFPRDEKGPAQSAAPIVFDASDHALMQLVADKAFRDETAFWLKDAYPERFEAFDAQHMDAAVAHIMAEGTRVGCELKDDYAYLAHMMLTLGGWFARAGHPAALTDILTDGQASLRARLSRAFLPAYEASPQAALMAQWDAVKAYMSALPEGEQVTPPEFSAFTAQFLKSNVAGADAALAATKHDLAGLGLSMPNQGRLLVLTLIYGHRFYADPLRAWSGQPVDEVINAVWAATFG